MKIRIADRLLVALAGLVLLALCASVVAQVFFQVPLTDYLASALAAPSQAATAFIVFVVALLLIVGVYCICLLFRHRKGKRGFVMQQTENGELSIAVKAMERLVHQCVECHPEMKLLGVSLEPGKEGVTVKLRINLASGVSIPLAVGALQKQIRTYVTSCSGVDVKEVCVQVETTSELATDSPYAVPGLMANPPALLREGAKPEAPCSGEEERDERPIHQRLFGHDAQPATVPTPPVEEAPAQAEPEAEAADAPEEAPEPAERDEQPVTDNAPDADQAEEPAAEEPAQAEPEAEAEDAPDETVEPEDGDEQPMTDDDPEAEQAEEPEAEESAQAEPEAEEEDVLAEESAFEAMVEPEESDEQAVTDDGPAADQAEEEPAPAAEGEEEDEWAKAEVDGHEVAE